MKRDSLTIFAIVLLLVGLGVAWFVWRAPTPAAIQAEAPIVWQAGPPTSLSHDAEEIFKKALWRRPSPEDKILHAERHEWSDDEGVNRWQWFLVIEASPDLIRYLRDDNAFGLIPGMVEPVTEAPAWFAFNPTEVSVLKSPHGGMRLMFSKDDNTLYAKASGLGFTKGASAPASAPAPAPGRIPSSAPPNPK